MWAGGREWPPKTPERLAQSGQDPRALDPGQGSAFPNTGELHQEPSQGRRMADPQGVGVLGHSSTGLSPLLT